MNAQLLKSRPLRAVEDAPFDPAALPLLEDLSPDMAKLSARKAELQGRRQKLGEEIRGLITALATTGAGDGKAEDAGRQSRVAALLDGITSAAPSQDLGRLKGCLTEMQREAGDLDQALRTLDGLIDRGRRTASRALVDHARPEYGRIIGDICRALVAAHEAQLAYSALVGALEQRRASWTVALNPLPPTFLDDPMANRGPVARYLREASKSGYFDPDLIPENLRPDSPAARRAAAQAAARAAARAAANSREANAVRQAGGK